MPAFLAHWITAYGSAAIFGLLLLGVFGLPVPDETLLTFAGVLVHDGRLGFATTWTAAALGSMCGITLNYIVGRTAGSAVVHRYGRLLHLTSDDLHRVEAWLERRGKWTLTVGYFIPGVRHLTGIVAGSTELPLSIFASFAFPGAVGWTLAFISLGRYVGARWETVLAEVHRHVAQLVALAVIAGGGYIIAHVWWARRARRRNQS
jgi:membrane protein DedA with SNARE-associated domain